MIRRQQWMERTKPLRGLVATLVLTLVLGTGCGAATSSETKAEAKKKFTESLNPRKSGRFVGYLIDRSK